MGLVPVPAIGEGEVLLKVSYSAVNRADTLQRKGGYPTPPGASPYLGLEAVGEVWVVGEGVQGWQVACTVYVE